MLLTLNEIILRKEIKEDFNTQRALSSKSDTHTCFDCTDVAQEVPL